MEEVVGNLVTQITQFGVTTWEPQRCIQDIPVSPGVFLKELSGEGSEFSTHRQGQTLSPGVQEFLSSCSSGMAEPCIPWQLLCLGGCSAKFRFWLGLSQELQVSRPEGMIFQRNLNYSCRNTRIPRDGGDGAVPGEEWRKEMTIPHNSWWF